MWLHVPRLPMGGSPLGLFFWMEMLYLGTVRQSKKGALFHTAEMGVLLGKFGWSD